MTVVGFLHTGAVHVATFHRLFTELAPPGLDDRHLVDESLLADARVAGVTPELAGRLRDRLAELVASGADLSVCTCSTIGAEAETTAVGVPVLRLDRPMAEAAVAAGDRIAVVATVASTMEPTMRLLRETADRAGRPVRLLPSPCLAAWRHFEAGDLDAYDDEIARHVRAIAGEADVVVLAQASMAGAAALLPGLPVLTSPRAAVEEAIRQAVAGPASGRTAHVR
ncbi:aspartate/glutamate racemase family protein [Actinoplanes sp. NEAU-A12]|uniref:Aspartate/glutamate racemase family protein n=1 Tax=Actinoplanes sandaracinus TaxID=3045177 RepID=A0ABT6WG05_9ACTN|nr:aspartate/glutamate racemase family protein [Actinoplanes sandaracinus]MDI6098670.1 aspartate/glutamate racemase family protein [Actinoplanes sandaracinus]